MDERIARGLTSAAVADRIAKGIERRRREVYIGQREIFGLYLSRWAPNLFHRILRNTTLK
jgi:hypothetical protein